MEEENEAILIAIIIGAVILGIGLAMFFNRPYTGFGAVVLAIGLMTLSLILTMRAEEIIHLKIYPTAARSETIAEVSVETQSPTKPAPEVLEVEETRQVQEVPETPEYHENRELPETEETQQVQQVEENQEPWQTQETPEAEETQEPQEVSFEEPEQEQESSIEVAPPSLEQS